MRKARIFLLNGFILTMTALLLRTIGVSFNVYISNKIGAEGIGIFQLIMSVYLFFITIANSGINLASTRIVSEELAYCVNGKCNKVIKQCLFYSITLGSIAAFLLTLAAPYISSVYLHNKVSPTVLRIIAISFPFVSMSATINGYFSAMRKVGKTAVSQVLEEFVQILVTTYFFTRFFPNTLDFSILAIVLGIVTSEIISFLYLYILYCWDKKKQAKNKDIHSKHYLKSILRISLPVAITSYIRSGLSSMKQLLIPLRLEKSGLDCNTAVAKYGMVSGMAMPILLFPSVVINSFSSLLIPEFSYYAAKKDISSIQNVISHVFKVTFLFSIGVMGVFLNFSEELSTVIYHSTEIGFFIKLLSPLVLFMYLDTIVDNILKGLDKQLGVMGVNILDLFVSISFIYFLLPIFGIYGYIIVIFISELLNSIISLWQLLRVVKVNVDILNCVIKPLAGILVSSLLLRILPFALEDTLQNLILHIVVFIFSYLVFLFASRCFNHKDIRFWTLKLK